MKRGSQEGEQEGRNEACSFGWWLVADADLFREKSIVGWLVVTGLF
jgi:hypothetical protein